MEIILLWVSAITLVSAINSFAAIEKESSEEVVLRWEPTIAPPIVFSALGNALLTERQCLAHYLPLNVPRTNPFKTSTSSAVPLLQYRAAYAKVESLRFLAKSTWHSYPEFSSYFFRNSNVELQAYFDEIVRKIRFCHFRVISCDECMSELELIEEKIYDFRNKCDKKFVQKDLILQRLERLHELTIDTLRNYPRKNLELTLSKDMYDWSKKYDKMEKYIKACPVASNEFDRCGKDVVRLEDAVRRYRSECDVEWQDLITYSMKQNKEKNEIVLNNRLEQAEMQLSLLKMSKISLLKKEKKIILDLLIETMCDSLEKIKK